MNFLDKLSYNQYVNSKAGNRSVIGHITISTTFSPEELVEKLSPYHKALTLIDFYANSALQHFSFIGINPLCTLKSYNGISEVIEHGKTTYRKENAFQILREIQQKQSAIYFYPDARLTGSAVGSLGYDAIRYIEEIKTRHTAKEVPDIDVNFFEYGIYFNYQEKTITFSKYITKGTKNNYEQSMVDIENLISKISSLKTENLSNNLKIKKESALLMDLLDDEYANSIEDAKKYIKEGDVFQLVLSRSFQKEFPYNPFNLYKALLRINPSPFHFYIKNPEYSILAASPEKIINIKDKVITSTPLAGTKPIENDINHTITTLIHDEKELAEHMMLVDLARNDIGKVSVPGTVKVLHQAYPLILKNIVHIASDVTSNLSADHDSIDALKASFPAGTLTGAPKIRAMQLIDLLESSNRGFYGGTVFCLDHEDNLDTCIIIRYAEIKNKIIKFRSGAGIVHDSDPKTESLESKHKANAMLKAISICEQGV